MFAQYQRTLNFIQNEFQLVSTSSTSHQTEKIHTAPTRFKLHDLL